MADQKIADHDAGRCPICGTPLPRDAMCKPFCSSRCRMVDLNRWLGGEYKISRAVEQGDIEEGE